MCSFNNCRAIRAWTLRKSAQAKDRAVVSTVVRGAFDLAVGNRCSMEGVSAVSDFSAKQVDPDFVLFGPQRSSHRETCYDEQPKEQRDKCYVIGIGRWSLASSSAEAAAQNEY